MSDYAIEAQQRTIVGKKVRQLRNQGLVPVTVYGPKIAPTNLQVPYRPLEITLSKAGGTHLIELNVEGKSQTVLAREVQRNVLKGTITHVDFFVVDQSSVIRTVVPIQFMGESPAVEARKGILITGPNTISIETLPKNLISQIEIDLSKLVEVGDAVFVKDLELGADITILDDPDEMIVRVSQTSAARAEEDLNAEESSSSEPEVISKGKGDDDED